MKWLTKILKDIKAPSAIDPLIGKTVIHFTTHGCMGTIHEFDFIGSISGIGKPPYGTGTPPKMYEVKILKDRGGEKRDDNVKYEYRTVPAHYLQDLGGDFLIAYD